MEILYSLLFKKPLRSAIVFALGAIYIGVFGVNPTEGPSQV
jgi:hypothetical protein